MFEEFYENKDLNLLLCKHASDIITFLRASRIQFDLLVKMKEVSFMPKLPEKLRLKEEIALFALGGYTLDSIEFSKDKLQFHAGFGADDFPSMVSVPLKDIIRITVGKTVVFINFTTAGEDEVEKSTNIFKSNPNNKDIFKN